MTSTELCRRLPALLLPLLLAACGVQPFRGADPDAAPFLVRQLTQADGSITVTAAVPDAAETIALTGLDLYGQGIQPVWLRVENRGEKTARVALRSIDRDYFSPIEVAYMNRKRFSSSGYADMERWFHANGMPRKVYPGETRSGLVFTHLRPGTKGFNLDVISAGELHNFTFFVPMPGFVADYMEVDFAHLYDPGDMRDLAFDDVQRFAQEELPCCASGPTEGSDGGPLNEVFVATPLALRRALLRGGWWESAAGAEQNANARDHLYRGRPADAIFYVVRADGKEQINLQLWLSPFTVEGVPVWLGQVFYKEYEDSLLTGLASADTLRRSRLLSRFLRESVEADIDSAQRFLLQNLWYNQSLSRFGIVRGMEPSTAEDPHVTFDGIGYFSDGLRHVLFLSETPVALDRTRILYNERAPTAGGAQ